MDSQNHYKTLQVDPEADSEVIEGAYRRLAGKYHLDVNHAPDATQRMQAINEAYEVLRDPVRRREYDRLQPRTQVNREAEAERKRRETEERATRERQETERRQRAGRDELVLTLVPGVTMAFVRVPAGEFLMGDNNSSWDAERPQHTVYLDAYGIGKTPVTNAQYAVYAKAAKLNWSIPAGKADRPVVSVSWDDAVAFCKWASQATRQSIQLPTEAQWEKAARGTDGRIYPWGNDQPDANRCNFAGNVKGTTSVGKYSPGGDSPYGCVDMAGNTWDWCADWYDGGEYARRANTTVKNPTGPSQGKYRVLRGGAWYHDAADVRCAHRFVSAPSSRSGVVGFRVCASSISTL